ncbi:flavin reductase (DIM6/NTAB) family NADH-FMN oxidoreductase RutF [Rhodococcus sp. OK519]|uniref:flavin reductase family protein n=1 Tax=Rhodococcus sp. OK519 TaxID=2135729 RepID=UPI000D350253|nr:flavin reductase (DIM6/NTAB) family NADH-FMN oxidoreductase RutF [Rhodococcus sp. OK519]
MKSITTGTDPTAVRAAFANIASGVTAVCAELEGEVVGMAASSFTAVSLDPPLVSVCVMNGSRTWRRLQDAPRLGVSVLAADQGSVCRALGSKGGDRFADIATLVTPEGAVLVRGAGVWLECELQSLLPGGDHTIVLLRVLGLEADTEREPLVYLAGSVRALVPLSPSGVDGPVPTSGVDGPVPTSTVGSTASEGALS